jgi:hypothetical protein
MINRISNSLLIVAIGGTMLTGSAIAQTTSTTSGAGAGVVDPSHPRVNQVNRRQTRQQQRIAQGVSNGSLNATQTGHLENREAQVQRREQKDMAAHNGHLTRAEQKGINRQQNRISNTIAKDKHQ